MKQYQLSASIVVYKNDPEEVVAAIRSVVCAPMSVLCTVIDNSPTRELEQYVKLNGAKYIHAGANLGFGAGHNLALQEVCDLSEYHLVLNPDVHFDPQILVSLYRFMDINHDTGLVMPQVLYPDGSHQDLCKQLPSPFALCIRRFLGDYGRSIFAKQLDKYELRGLDLQQIREIPCLSGCFMLIRSNVLRQVGFFDERFFMYMEDVDLCRRIGSHYQTVFYPNVSVTHGYGKGSYRNRKLLKYHLESACRYFTKWGWLHDPERNRLNLKILPINADADTAVNPSVPTAICFTPTTTGSGPSNHNQGTPEPFKTWPSRKDKDIKTYL